MSHYYFQNHNFKIDELNKPLKFKLITKITCTNKDVFCQHLIDKLKFIANKFKKKNHYLDNLHVVALFRLCF